MGNIIVVYQSKYGSTKKYAEWLAEELSCDLIEKKNISIEKLLEYDTIIYGGGLYAGGISGINLITKNFDKLSNKNLILFTCGLADTNNKENIDSIKNSISKILSVEMQDKIKIFHLRGGIDYKKLNFVHKAMMKIMYNMLCKKDAETLKNDDKDLIATYGDVVDFTNKTTIKPIVEYVKFKI